MEQKPRKTWTMKHPALAKAFAVFFAVMSIIMLAAGFSGIGKANEDNAERLRYEKKYAERIANYDRLCKELENSITYDELWAELEKEIEQHEDDASQHKTDLALNTAERGGYTMGADMIWEAVPDMQEARRQLAIGKAQLKEQESNMDFLRKTVEQLSGIESAIQYCDVLMKQYSMLYSHEHVWGEGVESQPATCTENGIKSYTCACGAGKNETIPAGHTLDEGVVTTEAGCTTAGVKTFSCTVCKEEIKTETIEASHKWGEGVETTAPTCTTKGVKTYKCTVCGENKSEDIPQSTEHTWIDAEVITAPRCTAEGSKTIKCSVEGCTASDTVSILELGHAWDSGKEIEGGILYTCTREGCVAKETKVIENEPVAASEEPATVPEELKTVPDSPEVNMAKRKIRVRYDAQIINDPIDSLVGAAQQLAAGIGYDGTVSRETLGDALGDIRAKYAEKLTEAETMSQMPLSKMREILKAYDEGVAALKAGEEGLNTAQANLENIWYELEQLDEERDELITTRDRLNEEAAKLSKQVMEADELQELENERTSAKLLLTSVKEVRDMVDGGEEIIPSAEKYLADYKAQTQLQHKGRLVSCALAMLGGLAGLAAIPAVYEFSRRRVWLIAPVIVCAVCAAAAEGIYYAVGLGWWYVGMFTAIIALIHLVIVAPKEKKPVIINET